jgi:hypothetical protein
MSCTRPATQLGRRPGAHDRRQRRAVAPVGGWRAHRIGARADLTVFKANPAALRHARHPSRSDVRLTMISGEPAIAEPSFGVLFDATGVDASSALLDGSPRLVARWIARHVRACISGNPASVPDLMVALGRSRVARHASPIGSKACRSSRCSTAPATAGA